MDGMLFYWFFWTFWTLSTFFMKKYGMRFYTSFWLLLAIIFSNKFIYLFGFNVSLAGLLMMGTAYWMMAKQSKSGGSYLFLTSFIVMLAYAAFHLFELFDPVWLLLNRRFMLSFVLAYLSISVQHGFWLRIMTLFLGAIHGEILYAVILKKFDFAYAIGSMMFLDVMAISLALIVTVSGLKKASAFFEQHFHHLEREKHRSS